MLKDPADLRFDDRLLTVLSQPGSDPHDVAVRWRQLVDLVARSGAYAGSPVIEQALAAIREDAAKVDEPLRAAAARAIAALPLPLSLLQYFAADRLAVSAPILAAATLDAGQWQAVLASADEETGRFIHALHPDVGTPEPDMTEQLVASTDEPAPDGELETSLHDVIDRIERRRRTRTAVQQRAVADRPRDPVPSLFRWECGAGGDISWVDGAPRGPLIGRSIARQPVGGRDRLDSDVVRSFAMRAPFRDAELTLAGGAPVAGDWKISGVPAFDPVDGRFIGYRGIALRDQQEQPVPEAGTQLAPDADSVRELVHEIKTPLTAIIGFAEIIEGQYLGPAERVYRDRAQKIVRQARLLLAAIDDLDFVARIQSSAGARRSSINLGELVERIVPALRELGDARNLEVAASRPIGQTFALVEPELADRLIFRLGSAIIGEAEAGEQLRIAVEQAGDRSRVSFSRPARLAAAASGEERASGDGFDAGFQLRLVKGLARSAGAELVTSHRAVALVFHPA